MPAPDRQTMIVQDDLYRPDPPTKAQIEDYYHRLITIRLNPECFSAGFKERAEKAEVAEVPEGIKTRPA